MNRRNKDGEYEKLEGEISDCIRILATNLFLTNATPEAIEAGLSKSNGSKGFFSAVSTEQGLANTLLGLAYGSDRVANNDIMLNGFDGGYISTARIGRQGYTGQIAGGALMFAQGGSIENLLKASNGTGLAERFLKLAEPHNLGKINYLEQGQVNHELLEQYEQFCQFAYGALKYPKELDELDGLSLSDKAWIKIKEFRNEIGQHLADGGKYSLTALRGAAGKIDMQDMKIAAVLHLLSESRDNNIIDDSYVISAINISKAMLEADYKLCMDKGLIGAKAEYTAILKLYEVNSKPRTEREIIQTKSKAVPFKDFTGNKSKLIKSTLADMVKDGVLKETFTPDSVKMYSLAQ